jgi:ribosomal protein L20A (L18A)
MKFRHYLVTGSYLTLQNERQTFTREVDATDESEAIYVVEDALRGLGFSGVVAGARLVRLRHGD